MENDNIMSNGLNNVILIALGTSVITPLSYELEYSNYLTTSIRYEQLDNQKQWEQETEISELDFNYLNEVKKIQTLKSFSENILKNAESLDEETIEIINNKFWELF